MLQTWWNSAKELVREVHGTVPFLFTITCILRVLHGSDPALVKRDSNYGTYGNGYRYGVQNSMEHPVEESIPVPGTQAKKDQPARAVLKLHHIPVPVP
jgi:hypothetical protein